MARCLCCGRIFSSWDYNFNVFQLINKRKTGEYWLWETDNNFFLTLNGWNIWAFKLIKHWNESFTWVYSGGVYFFFIHLFLPVTKGPETLDWTWQYILLNITFSNHQANTQTLSNHLHAHEMLNFLSTLITTTEIVQITTTKCHVDTVKTTRWSSKLASEWGKELVARRTASPKLLLMYWDFAITTVNSRIGPQKSPPPQKKDCVV